MKKYRIVKVSKGENTWYEVYRLVFNFIPWRVTFPIAYQTLSCQFWSKQKAEEYIKGQQDDWQYEKQKKTREVV